MPFSPPSCHFIPLQFKYSPQCPVLKHSQSMFPPQMSQTKFHSHKKTRKIIILHYVIFTFLDADVKGNACGLNGSKHYQK
jgi:hypothetical protein